jgi:hypothetical protein
MNDVGELYEVVLTFIIRDELPEEELKAVLQENINSMYSRIERELNPLTLVQTNYGIKEIK